MTTLARIWKHPITRIIAFLLIFFAITFALSLILLLDFRASRVTSDLVRLTAFSVAEGLSALIAFCFMVRLVDKRSFQSAGFTLRGLASETTIGYLIGMAILSVVIGIMAAVGVYRMLGQNHAFHPLLPLILFLGAGAAEEIVFRGYIFQTLEAKWGSRIALIFSCLLFGFAHIGNPGSHANMWQFLAGPAFICLEAGLPLAAGYMATRRLWLPIGMHWAWNFFEGPVFGSSVSGISLGTLYKAKFVGPFYLTGGSFGPEASVIALIVGTVAGLLLLRVVVRAGHWKTGEQLLPEPEVIQSENSEPSLQENDGKETL